MRIPRTPAQLMEVVMTLHTSVTDDQLGQYTRRVAAIADRLGKSLDFVKTMQALQRIHDGELDPVVLRVGDFPIFLACEVGGKPKDELLAEIEASGMFASNYAKDIMSKDAWKPGKRESMKFGKARVRDFGFTKNPTTTELFNRIEELGHSLCEPGDGPALRVAFKNQPRGSVCWTAMKQITASDGGQNVFGLGRSSGGEAWLVGYWASPGGKWFLGDEVVFRLRK